MAGTDSSKPPTRSIPSGIGDEMIEIDTYQEIHWPQNQNLVGERFPLNPILRHWFDQTPNTERESLVGFAFHRVRYLGRPGGAPPQPSGEATGRGLCQSIE